MIKWIRVRRSATAGQHATMLASQMRRLCKLWEQTPVAVQSAGVQMKSCAGNGLRHEANGKPGEPAVCGICRELSQCVSSR